MALIFTINLGIAQSSLPDNRLFVKLTSCGDFSSLQIEKDIDKIDECLSNGKSFSVSNGIYEFSSSPEIKEFERLYEVAVISEMDIKEAKRLLLKMDEVVYVEAIPQTIRLDAKEINNVENMVISSAATMKEDKPIVAMIGLSIPVEERLSYPIWVNEIEMFGKPKIDDDKNGYVDDVNGWDVVNWDNNPFVKNAGGEDETMLLKKLVNIDGVQIMAIRGADESRVSQRNNWDAFLYAVRNGVDIIACMWEGSDYSITHHLLIQYAIQKGIAVILPNSNEQTKYRYPQYYQMSTRNFADIESVR